jgi:hypothetical protein
MADWGRPGRGVSSRQSVRASFRTVGSSGRDAVTLVKTTRAADTVKEKAQAHYDKHKDSWAVKRLPAVLNRQTDRLSLNPPGARPDHAAQAMATARMEVAAKQAGRLKRIERARDNMATSGRIRQTRKIDWGAKKQAGLGE